MKALTTLVIATVTVLVVALPARVEAQPPARPARVGWIAYGAESPASAALLEAFLQGLRDRGWVGEEISSSTGDGAAASRRATSRPRSSVDVIVSAGPMVFGAQAAGTTS